MKRKTSKPVSAEPEYEQKLKTSALIETEVGWTFGVKYDADKEGPGLDEALQDESFMKTLTFRKTERSLYVNDDPRKEYYGHCLEIWKDTLGWSNKKCLGIFKDFIMTKTAISSAKERAPVTLRRDFDSTILKLCEDSPQNPHAVEVTEYDNSYQAINDYLNKYSEWLEKQEKSETAKNMQLKWAAKEAFVMLKYSYSPNDHLPSSDEVAVDPSARKKQYAWFNKQKNMLPTEKDDFCNWYAVKANAEKEGKKFFLDFEKYQNILDIIEQAPGAKSADEVAVAIKDSESLIDEVLLCEKKYADEKVEPLVFSTSDRKYTAIEVKTYCSLKNVLDPNCEKHKSAAEEMCKEITSQYRISFLKFQEEEDMKKAKENIPQMKSTLLAAAASRSGKKTYTVDRL